MAGLRGTSVEILESFFREPIGEDLARQLEQLPLDQYDELMLRLESGIRHWFQQAVRDRQTEAFQPIASGDATSLQWLKGALLYLPGPIAIYDPIVDPSFSSFHDMQVYDEHRAAFNCRAMANAVRELAPLRPLLETRVIDLIPQPAVHLIVDDLLTAMQRSGTFAPEVHIGTGGELFFDPPGDEFHEEDLTFWVPDQPPGTFFRWALSLALASASPDARSRMDDHEMLSPDWWAAYYSGGESHADYDDRYIPHVRHWLSSVLGNAGVAITSRRVSSCRDDLALLHEGHTATKFDMKVVDLVEEYHVPSFSHASLKDVVSLRSDDECFVAFRSGFDDVYTRVINEDPEDEASYRRALHRHARDALGSRQVEIRRATSRSGAMSHLVGSAFAIGGTAATWEISNSLPTGGLVGLATGQAAYLLNGAIERRRATRDGRHRVSEFFSYLIDAK